MRALTLFLFAGAAVAQSEEPKIVVNLDGFSYPRLAAMANIEGEVVFAVTAAGRRLISQQSNVAAGKVVVLLAGPAEKNLATWTLPRLDHGSYQVRYRFVLLHDPACEGSSRTFPAEQSESRSGDDVMIEVLVKATRECAHY